MMDIVALKVELLAGHPSTGAYSIGSDSFAAEELNAKNVVRDVESVSGQAIFEAVVLDDYNALTSEQKQLLSTIIGMGTILVNGTNTRIALLSMFGIGTTTRSALGELQTETVSRATLLGLGTVYEGHIQQARAI